MPQPSPRAKAGKRIHRKEPLLAKLCLLDFDGAAAVIHKSAYLGRLKTYASDSLETRKCFIALSKSTDDQLYDDPAQVLFTILSKTQHVWPFFHIHIIQATLLNWLARDIIHDSN